LDLATGVLTRMTRDSRDSPSGNLAWSPDSKRLAVTTTSGGIREITVASGKVATLVSGDFLALDWLPGGRSLLCTDGDVKRFSLFTLGDGAAPQTIHETPDRNFHFHLSPDGKYVVYSTIESGRADVYVASFPSFAAKRKVSTNGGLSPVWRKDGKEVLYMVEDGRMMSSEIRTGPELVTGTPKLLFQYASGPTFGVFDVSADGERFLMMEAGQGNTSVQPEIAVVLNWPASLK
jgi:Tol biopolymer transport system component